MTKTEIMELVSCMQQDISLPVISYKYANKSLKQISLGQEEDGSLIITISAVGFLWELMELIFASVRLLFFKCLHISAVSFSSATEKNWSRQEQKFQ